MGGLQKATRWEGPMLTDSGGYQIFSMGHGSVGNEIKGRRGAEGGAEFGKLHGPITQRGGGEQYCCFQFWYCKGCE